jgi:hypothetical protein
VKISAVCGVVITELCWEYDYFLRNGFIELISEKNSLWGTERFRSPYPSAFVVEDTLPVIDRV